MSYFERDPNLILKELQLFQFPDNHFFEVRMIAASIKKSIRTAYRLLEKGDIPVTFDQGKIGAKAMDVKSWVLRKYRTVPNKSSSVRSKVKARWIYMKNDSTIGSDSIITDLKRMVILN